MRFLVQHHPSRAFLLERWSGYEIVTDPDPDGSPQPWRTYRACLEALGADAGVVVQDDAVAVRDFRGLAAAAMAECPCRVLTFFASRQLRYGSNLMLQAGARGESFANIGTADHFVPAVALGWPAGVAAEVLAWADNRRWNHRAGRADDAILKDAAMHLGLEVWATVPSLVDHLDDVPSVMGSTGAKSRRALLPHPDISPWPREATEEAPSLSPALQPS